VSDDREAEPLREPPSGCCERCHEWQASLVWWEDVATSDTQAGTQGFDVCIGAGVSLDAAAEAIGIDTAELASALRDGDAFADVARAHDVPVSDVVDAVVGNEQERLGQLVEDGRLTRGQADALSDDLRERATS
jgi:hypothetical protein